MRLGINYQRKHGSHGSSPSHHDLASTKEHRPKTVTSPLIAEALALRSGIITAVDMGISDLQMLSDNLKLVRVINNGMQNSEIYGIVKDIQQISSAFVDITFSHVFRSLNGEADTLAKATLISSSVLDPSIG